MTTAYLLSSPEAKKKAAARQKARRAFPELQPCSKCGSTENVQRHHEDYDKPLEIDWICRSCHYDMHSKRRDPCKDCGAPNRAPKQSYCAQCCYKRSKK